MSPTSLVRDDLPVCFGTSNLSFSPISEPKELTSNTAHPYPPETSPHHKPKVDSAPFSTHLYTPVETVAWVSISEPKRKSRVSESAGRALFDSCVGAEWAGEGGGSAKDESCRGLSGGRRGWGMLVAW